MRTSDDATLSPSATFGEVRGTQCHHLWQWRPYGKMTG